MGTRGGVSVAVPLLHLLTAGPATGPAGNGGLPGAITPALPGALHILRRGHAFSR